MRIDQRGQRSDHHARDGDGEQSVHEDSQQFRNQSSAAKRQCSDARHDQPAGILIRGRQAIEVKQRRDAPDGPVKGVHRLKRVTNSSCCCRLFSAS